MIKMMMTTNKAWHLMSAFFLVALWMADNHVVSASSLGNAADALSFPSCLSHPETIPPRERRLMPAERMLEFGMSGHCFIDD